MEKLVKNLNEIQKKISYGFYNKKLLIQAFTRRSYTQENGGANNETLEFIGDRVLDFFVTKILIDRYGSLNSARQLETAKYKNEGELTAVKTKLVNKKNLATRIDSMGFSDCLLMGTGDKKAHLEDEESVKEDLFEAILGAIAIDSKWNYDDLENSVSFMLDMDNFLNNGLIEEDNYVSLLQQWNQKFYNVIPNYEYEEVIDGFKCMVTLNTKRGLLTYEAISENKQEARMKVSMLAYKDLEANDELFTIENELPDEITVDNAVNVLQELAQKGYFSMPEYYYFDEPIYSDIKGDMKWECTCVILSYELEETVRSTTKKQAKKEAAYQVLRNMFPNKVNE